MRDCDGFASVHPAAVLVVPKDGKLSLERKTKGNELFGKGKFLEALEEYTEAIDLAPLSNDFDKHRSVFYCNRAACCLELGRNEAAVEDCTRAIELDKTYIKALLRRSKAYDKLDQLEDSLADLDAVLAIDPKAPGVKAERDKMESRVKEKAEKLKDEMMGKLKDLGNSFLGYFGMSLDNFKFEQDPNTGSYSVSMKQ